MLRRLAAFNVVDPKIRDFIREYTKNAAGR